MRAFSEELFGAAAVVYRVRDAAEAVALANASSFGLGGSVWTADEALAAQEAISRAQREEWARVVAALARRSVTSTSPRKRRPRRSRPPSGGGRPAAYPPTPAAG
jgi:Aldehyde dehydrogenase family